jgi:hypothetical protein
MGYEDSKLMKVQVVQPYLDRSYVSKSGKNVRFVVGRFKQRTDKLSGEELSIEEGTLRYRGAMLVVDDKDSDREAIEVYSGDEVLHQLKQRKSRLFYLIRRKVEPEEFLEELELIINSTLDINPDFSDESPLGEK